ncbi:hypothetical protein B0H13DRAFT_1858214 [Mycena leptocephala]|nr:hypothetical protein B0H13DRAFT_1858214 [Mycena leptocephala]
MKALPGTIVTTRDSMLSKCAATCHNAAGLQFVPIWPPPASAPMRTSVPTFYHACKANARPRSSITRNNLWLVFSLTAKPTATVPFLPTNANVDINEPSHTRNPRPRSDFSGNWIPKHRLNPDREQKRGTGRAIAASVVIVVLIVVLIIFVWWWIRRRRQRIRERRFQHNSSNQRRQFNPKSLGQLWCRESRWMRPSQKGAPARTHNLRLINFSDVPAEENAAQASNAQDAANTEEAVTVRLRRVEAQLAALLTPAVESPEELPPKTVESIRNEDCERLSWVNYTRRMGSESPAWRRIAMEWPYQGYSMRMEADYAMLEVRSKIYEGLC